jgi:hypothetical protein
MHELFIKNQNYCALYGLPRSGGRKTGASTSLKIIPFGHQQPEDLRMIDFFSLMELLFGHPLPAAQKMTAFI